MLTGLAAVPVPGVVFRDTWRVVHGNAADGDPGYTVTNANPFDRANLFLDQRIDYVLAGVPKLGGVGHGLELELDDAALRGRLVELEEAAVAETLLAEVGLHLAQLVLQTGEVQR